MVITRSQTLRNLAPDPTSNDTISVNWCFIAPEGHDRAFDPCYIDIPTLLYESRAGECRSLFCKELRVEYKFDADPHSIKFWRPNTPLSEKATQKDWEVFFNHENRSFIPKIMSLSLALADVKTEGIVHLIVTADTAEEGDEERDQVSALPVNVLPESLRFQETVKFRGKSPSEAARSANYCVSQDTDYNVIYDGRYVPGSKRNTTAPPIYIYHRIFSFFHDQLQNPPEPPTEEDLENTFELMSYLCQLSPGRDPLRNDEIRTLLSRILVLDVLPLELKDGTITDGKVYIKIGDEKIAVLIMELKKELGNQYDPAVQASFSYKRHCLSIEDVRNKCCCPSFLIHGGGPWLGISGAVFTDKIIVQRLTDMHWFGFSSTEEDVRVWQNARVLVALRKTLLELANFYKKDLAGVDPWAPHGPHPRFYPYPTSYPHEGRTVRFKYQRALEPDSACMTFLAQTLTPDEVKDIVVKFVSRYGEKPHEFLADKGHAPKLFYCGPLPDMRFTSIPPEAKNAHPGLRFGPLSMVVMEYINVQPLEELPNKHVDEIKKILKKLHKKGYVFGDLRNQNILIDPKSRNVKLIDFNWSGKYDKGKHRPDEIGTESEDEIGTESEDEIGTESGGNEGYAYYPVSLSLSINWPGDVGRLKPILPAHDLEMVKRLITCSG